MPAEHSELKEELHRFTVTERYQPALHLQSFEPNLIRDKNHRQASMTLIPQFQYFYSKKLRPNFLGDVSTAVSRLHFKSNLGKVSLEDNYETLKFDPVEVQVLPS